MPDTSGVAQLTAAEQEVVSSVDEAWLLTVLDQLIAIPSVCGDEAEAQRWVARTFTDMGMAVDLWEMDLAEIAAHPDYSAEVERDVLLGLMGRIGSEGPSLMLNGHVDVVPAGDLEAWSTNPWRATHRDGHVFGRGACDMKGGLAAALAAVRAVQHSGVELAGTVLFAAVAGEEDGGAGTLGTLLRSHRADAAIVMEPTDLAICPVQAGALGFRLTVSGSPAHGALRHEGVSAVDKALPLFAALAALEHERNEAFHHPLFAATTLPLALSIGTVRAGDWPSTVPEHLVAEGRYGIAPGESVTTARSALEAAVGAAAAADPWLRRHPPTVEWWGGQFLPAETPSDAPIVMCLQASHRAVAGEPARLAGAPFGSDLRHLVNAGGIPTVLYGPGEMRWAHRTDEHVARSELLRAARVLAVAIVRWCGFR